MGSRCCLSIPHLSGSVSVPRLSLSLFLCLSLSLVCPKPFLFLWEAHQAGLWPLPSMPVPTRAPCPPLPGLLTPNVRSSPHPEGRVPTPSSDHTPVGPGNKAQQHGLPSSTQPPLSQKSHAQSPINILRWARVVGVGAQAGRGDKACPLLRGCHQALVDESEGTQPGPAPAAPALCHLPLFPATAQAHCGPRYLVTASLAPTHVCECVCTGTCVTLA